MKSTTQSGLWKVEFGELGATLKVLQDHGVTPDHLARLRAEPDYAKRVTEFMLRGGLDASIHQKLAARAVMGKNFFGVEDWSALYGVNFSQKQLRQVAEFPWDEDILNSTCPLCGKVVKDCHFAFVGLDRINGTLTILKLQEFHPATGQPKFCSYAPSAWYSEQKFAEETTMDFRWYLLHQNIVPKSENKTYGDQKAMFTAEYEVPSAITEVTKNLLLFRKTGNFVNQSRYARCECVTSGGNRVDAGYFDEGGLHVSPDWDDDHRYDLGVAASRKF